MREATYLTLFLCISVISAAVIKLPGKSTEGERIPFGSQSGGIWVVMAAEPWQQEHCQLEAGRGLVVR